MAVIIGSRFETPQLRELVSPEHRDLREYSARPEVQTIKDWADKQPHLPHITDEQITLFLNSADSSLERAKELIENYHTYRANAPEVFVRRPGFEKDLKDALEVVRLAPLPQNCKSRQGHVVAIMGLRDPNPQKFDFEKAVKANFIMVDMILGRNPLLKGYQVVYNLAGLSMAHLGKLNFSTLRKTLAYVQQASPIRLRAVHILNAAPLAYQLLEMFRPFMKKDLAEMIFLHTAADFDCFCEKFVAKQNLPYEYGGKLCPADQLNDEFYKDAVLAKDWLIDVGQGKVKENLRTGKNKKNMLTDMHIMGGSFKKLELD